MFEQAESSLAEEKAMADLEAALESFNWKEGVVEKAKRQLYSPDPEENVKGVMALKAMLCIGRDEVYQVAQEVIDAGVVARLVEFLRASTRDLRWPAAFCLTNVAAGKDEQTDEVVKAGAVDLLVQDTVSHDSQIRRQAIFCLANIAGSSPQHRELLANHPGYVSSLIKASSMTSDPKVVSLICWNFRNLCLLGGAQFEKIIPALEYFCRTILPRWGSRQWQPCSRFCLETLAACSRERAGREWLYAQGILPDLLGHVTSARTAPCDQALETAAWLLNDCASTEAKNGVVAGHADVLAIIIQTYIAGARGSSSQELALKLLVPLVMPDSEEDDCPRLDVLLARHEADILNSTSQVFIDVAASNDAKEAAAYLFIRAIYGSLENLLIKIMMTPTVFEIILNILDFAVAQTVALAVDRSFDHFERSVERSLDIGPRLVNLPHTLALSTLRLLYSMLVQGSILQQNTPGLGYNPVAKVYIEYDAEERIKGSLRNLAPLVECHEIGQKLLLAIADVNCGI